MLDTTGADRRPRTGLETPRDEEVSPFACTPLAGEVEEPTSVGCSIVPEVHATRSRGHRVTCPAKVTANPTVSKAFAIADASLRALRSAAFPDTRRTDDEPAGAREAARDFYPLPCVDVGTTRSRSREHRATSKESLHRHLHSYVPNACATFTQFRLDLEVLAHGRELLAPAYQRCLRGIFPRSTEPLRHRCRTQTPTKLFPSGRLCHCQSSLTRTLTARIEAESPASG